MNDFVGSTLFATIVVGGLFFGLLKLLIFVNQKHWRQEEDQREEERSEDEQ
jgi:hypothetical protein